MNIRLLLPLSPRMPLHSAVCRMAGARSQNGQSGWPSGRRSFGMYGTCPRNRAGPSGGQEVTDFCLGAFHDAFWLRWNNPRSIPRRILRAGSASRCSFCLSYLGGNQPRDVFISAGRQRRRYAIALSGRRRPGDDFERRLFRSAVPDHTFPAIISRGRRAPTTCLPALLFINRYSSECILPDIEAQNFPLAGQATIFSICSTCRSLPDTAIAPERPV